MGAGDARAVILSETKGKWKLSGVYSERRYAVWKTTPVACNA